MAPAKLHAQFTLDGAAPATLAKLAIDGSLGQVRVALSGEANADAIALSAGDLKLDGKLETDDGKALVAMLGLDRMLAVDAGPGALTLKTSGPARGEWRIDGKLIAGGLDGQRQRHRAPVRGQPNGRIATPRIARADAAPLRGGARAALPVTFAGNVALTAKDLTLSDIDATVAGATLRGKLALTLAAPHRLQGDIEADGIDAASLIAAAIGMPAPAGNDSHTAWVWSSEPFAGGVFGDYAGQIALKARRVDLLPRLTAREFRATLRFGKHEFAFDDMTGAVAGGRLAGQLSFRSAEDGVKAQAKISLTGADAASLLPSGARPPVTGSLGIVGRRRRHRLEPGRADRLAARLRQDRARRRAIRRPRSARLRCRHPRGRPGAGDRCRRASPTSCARHWTAASLRSSAPRERSPSAPGKCG